MRVAALRADAVDVDNGTGAVRISLGTHPVPVPGPFAELLRQHLQNRRNLRTGSGTGSPWLFPGTRAGQHPHPNSLMDRLRDLGVDLLGARKRVLDDHVLASPPPLVAYALG